MRVIQLLDPLSRLFVCFDYSDILRTLCLLRFSAMCVPAAEARCRDYYYFQYIYYLWWR